MYSYISRMCKPLVRLKSAKNMANFIDKLGEQVGNTATGGAIGMGLSMLDEAIFGDRRRKKQLEQQKKLQDMQIAGNKDLMDYGYEQQLAMWEATNYAEQVKQLKKAGLNPAMIYGSGGGGGEMGAGVAGTVGGDTASSEAEMMSAEAQMGGMGLDRMLIGAQARKLDAETRAIEENTGLTESKRKTEDETRDSVIELHKAKINEITEDIENKKVQRVGHALDNDLKRIEKLIGEGTLKENINNIKYQARQAKEEYEKLLKENEITEAVKEKIIENYTLQNTMLAVEMVLKNSSTEVNKRQAMKLVNDIVVENERLELEGKKMTETIRNNIANNRKIGVNQIGGKVLNDVYEFINAVGLKADKMLGIDKWFEE